MNENHKAQLRSVEQTISRLVDNELDAEQRAEFVRQADASPELWRETALAFIEDRVWGVAFEGQADSDSAQHRESRLPSEARTGKQRGGTNWWRHNVPRLMLTAAAVLFALTVALRLNPVDRSPGGLESGPVASQPPAQMPDSSVNTPTPGNTLAVNQEPYMLQMDDNVQVPLYQSFDPMKKELARLDLSLDPITQQQFLQAGYQVQPHINYITGNAPDGRSFIVPVQSYRVRQFVQ